MVRGVLSVPMPIAADSVPLELVELAAAVTTPLSAVTTTDAPPTTWFDEFTAVTTIVTSFGARLEMFVALSEAKAIRRSATLALVPVSPPEQNTQSPAEPPPPPQADSSMMNKVVSHPRTTRRILDSPNIRITPARFSGLPSGP